MSKFSLHILTGTTAQVVTIGNEVDTAQTDIATLQGRMTAAEAAIASGSFGVDTPFTFIWDAGSPSNTTPVTGLLSKRGRHVTLFMPRYSGISDRTSGAGFVATNPIPASLWPDHAYASGGLIAMPIVTNEDNGDFILGSVILDGGGLLQITKTPDLNTPSVDFWHIGGTSGWVSFSMTWFCVP